MRCHWILAALLIPGGVNPRLARADDVTATKAADTIEFKVGGSVAARYHVGPTVAKPYLWPVLAPGGVPVTRDWPMQKGRKGETTDHVHQKSVWFCHGDVIPEGVELKTKSANKADRGVDFWSESKDKDGRPRHGTIRCVKVGEPRQIAKDHAAVTTWNEWVSPDGVKVMDEERTIHVRDLPAGRLFVFEITLRATVCPITFGDTKEGSFGVRVRDELRMAKEKDKLGGDGLLTNDAGKAGEKDVWGQVANWCDYSGPLDGKTAGVAVFSHPDNPPAAWHARGYGLLAANPFGRSHSGFPSQQNKTDLVKIEKGKELKLKYAVYAHTGDAKTGKVAEAYSLFAK
jgi:hypothetical protein